MFLTFDAERNDIRAIFFGFIAIDVRTGKVRFMRHPCEEWMQKTGAHPIESWSYPPTVARGDAAVVMHISQKRVKHPDAELFQVARVGPGVKVRWVTRVPIRDSLLHSHGLRFLSLMSPDGWIALRGGWVDPDGKWHPDSRLDDRVAGLMADRRVLRIAKNGSLFPSSGIGREWTPLIGKELSGYVFLFYPDILFGLGTSDPSPLKKWMDLVAVNPHTGKFEILISRVFVPAVRWSPDGAWVQTVVDERLKPESVRFGFGRNVLLELQDFPGSPGWNAYPLAIAPVTENQWLVAFTDRILRFFTDKGRARVEVVLNNIPLVPKFFEMAIPGGLLTADDINGKWTIIPEQELHRDDLVKQTQHGFVWSAVSSDMNAVVLTTNTDRGAHVQWRAVLWPGMTKLLECGEKPAVSVSRDMMVIACPIRHDKRNRCIRVRAIRSGGRVLPPLDLELSVKDRLLEDWW